MGQFTTIHVPLTLLATRAPGEQPEKVVSGGGGEPSPGETWASPEQGEAQPPGSLLAPSCYCLVSDKLLSQGFPTGTSQLWEWVWLRAIKPRCGPPLCQWSRRAAQPGEHRCLGLPPGAEM